MGNRTNHYIMLPTRIQILVEEGCKLHVTAMIEQSNTGSGHDQSKVGLYTPWGPIEVYQSPEMQVALR